MQGGCKEGARRGFVFTLGSILACEDDFEILMMSFWLYVARFQKPHISRMDFDDFIKAFDQVEPILGSL